jgi:hypothetical protein
MALVLNDRVKETSTTTGTGTLNLSGAVSGFETFVAGVGDGNTTYYAIVNRDADEWEVGLGTVTDASTDTLARTTVITSSNSDSATSFSAGTKDVFVTLPASKAAKLDGSDNLIIGDGTNGSDFTLTFDGNAGDGVLTWMEDEDYFKFSDDILMNSTEKLQFQDTGTYIYSSTDGQLDLISDGAVVIDAETDITLDANGADVILKDGGTTFGSLTNSSGELVIKSGSTPTTAMTFSGANVTFSGTVTIGSAGINETELEILDGASVTTTELNIIDGDTSAGTTAVADGDGIVTNDAGTMRQTTVQTFATYFGSEITAMSNLVTTGALDSGSITSGFGAIDNGTSGIRTNTFTAETSIIPDAAGGADIGSTSAEWGDVYIADDKYIQFGNDQNVIVGYDEDGNDTLEFKANIEGAALAFTFSADQADDNADTWKLNFADGGDVTLQSYTSGSFATKLTLDTDGDLTIAGDLTVTGDDITLGTNTDTAIMVADGTNYNPVVPSGDVTLTNAGVFGIASGVIVNADINASAAIADSKLDTISTANKINIGALDIDGATDIGADLADADLFIVDDNAGGTERKMAASRIITYVEANASFTTKGFAIAMALVFG